MEVLKLQVGTVSTRHWVGEMFTRWEFGVAKSADLMCALMLPMDGQEKKFRSTARVLQCTAVYQTEILVSARAAESFFLVNCEIHQ